MKTKNEMLIPKFKKSEIIASIMILACIGLDIYACTCFLHSDSFLINVLLFLAIFAICFIILLIAVGILCIITGEINLKKIPGSTEYSTKDWTEVHKQFSGNTKVDDIPNKGVQSTSNGISLSTLVGLAGWAYFFDFFKHDDK